MIDTAATVRDEHRRQCEDGHQRREALPPPHEQCAHRNRKQRYEIH
jgi:hypothetical protein